MCDGLYELDVCTHKLLYFMMWEIYCGNTFNFVQNREVYIAVPT